MLLREGMMSLKKDKLVADVILILLLFYRYFLMWTRINSPITNFLIIGIAILSIILLFGKKINRRNTKTIIFAIVFIIISYINGKTIDIIVSFLLAFYYFNLENSLDDSINNFLKTYTLTSCVLYVTTICLSTFGVIKSIDSTRLVDGVTNVRNSFGFIHVNATFMYFVPIFLGLLYINKNKPKKRRVLLLIILDLISLVIYKASLCRTGFFMIILINVLVALKKPLQNSKIVNFIFKYFYVIIPFIIIPLVITSANDFSANSLNRALSFRPYYIYQALHNYSITFLGRNISTKVIIDCAYLKILINFGLISYVMFSYLNIKTYKLTSNYMLKITLITYLIYQVFEANYLYQTNFIMILQFMYMLRISGSHNNEIKGE